MLQLNNSLLFAKGANRSCYRHPLDSNKCIKIPNTGGMRTQILECNYYRRLESNNIFWKHLIRYFGEIETNLGRGYVYELVCDFDQSISLPLSDYFCSNPNKKIELEIILKSLAELKEYLLNNKIIVRNIRPYNIVFKRVKPQSGFTVIIDNIGHHNNLYHISDNFAFLAYKDILKKWNKFEKNLFL